MVIQDSQTSCTLELTNKQAKKKVMNIGIYKDSFFPLQNNTHQSIKSITFNKQMMRHSETFLQNLFMVGIQILTSNYSYLYLNYFWGFKPKV